MATTAASTPERESRQEKASKTEIVVVDLGQPQPSQQVRNLRKGRGKLMTRIERIVDDLIDAGTVKSTAHPVVIVVREQSSPFWFFGDVRADD